MSCRADYNNQLAFSDLGLRARNAAEAYRLQLSQVLGERWLDHNEYEIEAQAGGAVTGTS
jgi:hypothetical protein